MDVELSAEEILIFLKEINDLFPGETIQLRKEKQQTSAKGLLNQELLKNLIPINMIETDQVNGLIENNQQIEMQIQKLKNARQVPETIMTKMKTRRARVNPKVIPAQNERHTDINQKTLNQRALRAAVVLK